MTRRRAVAMPPGVSVRDAWSELGAIEGDRGQITPRVEVDGERRSKRQAENCRCNCRCGSSTFDPGGLCYLCGQGVHHSCSRACRAYDQMPTVWHGIKALSNYVPPRRACDGGEDSGPKRETRRPRRD